MRTGLACLCLKRRQPHSVLVDHDGGPNEKLEDPPVSQRAIAFDVVAVVVVALCWGGMRLRGKRLVAEPQRRRTPSRLCAAHAGFWRHAASSLVWWLLCFPAVRYCICDTATTVSSWFRYKATRERDMTVSCVENRSRSRSRKALCLSVGSARRGWWTLKSCAGRLRRGRRLYRLQCRIFRKRTERKTPTRRI